MILYEHFVKTRRLDLLQLLQALRLEGDLAVERGEVGCNGLLLGERRKRYSCSANSSIMKMYNGFSLRTFT